MKRAAMLLVVFLAFTATAEGKPYDPHGFTQQAGQQHDRARDTRTARPHREVRARVPRGGDRRAARPEVHRHAQILGGRPAGCPRQYCGCGTSIKLFGRIRPELNLAANWVRKFPRTIAAPGMAAARSGHVMLLLEHVAGVKWKVWDANSGGGLTRIHVRSISGFAIVNPHAVAAHPTPRGTSPSLRLSSLPVPSATPAILAY
jgi:hypothetical protein